VYRPLQFQKGSQDFIGAHDETLSVPQDRARIADDWRMANNPSRMPSTIPAHVYEVRPRSDKRGADLISDSAAIWSTLVWRAECDQQSNRLCEERRLILRENSRPLSLGVFGMSDGLLA